MSRFIPHFQPIIDIPSGKIAGYEALARQVLESGLIASCGPLFADPNIDKSFLLEMDRIVRRQAIEATKLMPEGSFLTLNISPEWIDLLAVDDSIPTLEMIRECGADTSKVIVEITETKGDLESLQRLVDLYRKHGFRIAIDDFGAGYSELGRLVALEPDLIKLDMRFFKSAVEGGIAHDAVRAIGFMAERIGCDILCEGVETEDEFNFAVDCGASLIQGFLFYQAEAEFIPTDQSRIQVKNLLSGFLSKKVEEEHAHVKRYQGILDFAHAIRSFCQSTDAPALEQLPPAPTGFIRFYLCDINGEQLSPNYDLVGENWYIDESYRGLNWSGRPYLYQILAIGNMTERAEVTTRPYRDGISRELFQTLGLRMNEDRILLVDFMSH